MTLKAIADFLLQDRKEEKAKRKSRRLATALRRGKQ
jgi:hypothetical protein